MTRFPVMFWGICSVLVVGAGLAAGQECDAKTKIKFDPPIGADDVTPLVGVPVPASCGDFQVTKLLVCQVDLEFKEGCCEQSCKDVLSSVDATCLADFIEAACTQELGKSVEILDNLARRCDDDYAPLSCSANGPPAPQEPAPQEPASATEVCSEETVKADEPVDVNKLTALASLAFPPSCDDFTLTKLVICVDELSIVKGCCQESCKEVLQPVSKECLGDLTRLVCASEYADSLPILQRVLVRCHDDPVEVDCSELESLGPAGEASEEETTASLDADADTAATPTNFFGSSSTPATPAASSTPTNFFGASASSTPASTSTPANFFGPQGSSAAPAPSKAAAKCAGEVDTNADIQRISAVLSGVDPDNCPAFASSDIFDCQKDISTLDGEENCCNPKCKEYIGGLTQDCYNEILSITCSQDPDIHHIFQRTAKRCLDDYKDQSCVEVRGAAVHQSTFTWAFLGSLLLIAMLVM